jgi:predicted dienelactone hydrolase
MVSKAKLMCVCENDCEPPECTAKRKQNEEKAAELALKKIKERDKKAQVEAKKAQAKRDKERAAEHAKQEKEKEKANSDPRIWEVWAAAPTTCTAFLKTWPALTSASPLRFWRSFSAPTRSLSAPPKSSASIGSAALATKA